MRFYNPKTDDWVEEEELREHLKSFMSTTNIGKITNSYSQLSVYGWYAEDHVESAPIVKAPTGEHVRVLPNCRAFAQSLGLCPDGFRRMVMGKQKSHRGWTFVANRPHKYKTAGLGSTRYRKST